MPINTTANIAARLGVSKRRVLQLIRELGIRTEQVGQTFMLTERDVAKIRKKLDETVVRRPRLGGGNGKAPAKKVAAKKVEPPGEQKPPAPPAALPLVHKTKTGTLIR